MINPFSIITCPEGRCNTCDFFQGLSCKKLMEISPSLDKIMIIEKSRNLVHLQNNNDRTSNRPPWMGGLWNTVFLGVSLEDMLKHGTIIDAYQNDKYLSIITKSPERHEHYYHSQPLIKSKLEHDLLESLRASMRKITKGISISKLTFNDRIVIKRRLINDYLRDYLPEMAQPTREKLAIIASHQESILRGFIPLFYDGEIEEIFLDRPETPVYIDHRRHGRCFCDFTISTKEVEKLTTIFRLESNLHLDRRNPSLKMDFRFDKALLRVSTSVAPLSTDGFQIAFRRAATRPFSIIDLVLNNTISLEVAAVLIIAVNLRFNITITGEPGSGKTTLLNALDMATPTNWRKIYIEDVVESRVSNEHHQARIRVDPFDERMGIYRKQDEIIKSLHRSPDYMILGEVQTRDHVNALFQSMAAGLHTIQTCHSRSASELVSRWKYSLGENSENIALMDIIVTMCRPIPGSSKRIVREVVETERSIEKGVLSFVGLNTLFDINKNDASIWNWSSNGAFFLRLIEYGCKKPEAFISKIRSRLREENDTKNLDDVLTFNIIMSLISESV